MADYERMVLEHYQLSTPWPEKWPDDKNLSDASDDEDAKPKRNGIMSTSKARYSVLERSASDRRSLPGSQRTGDGVENLVQKDEPDPLGSTDSVVRVLQQQGLPIQQDSRLRELDNSTKNIANNARQSVPTLINDLLTCTLSVTGAFRGIYSRPSSRSRRTFKVH
jgi:hypothetical protein